jgi:hypothetical protein
MGPPEFNYGLLKLSDQNVNGSMLLGRNFSQWTAIRKGGLDADRLMENRWGDMIRVGYVTHTHPGAYRLVPMFTPVSRPAKGPRRE